ncbi:26S proteasome subunit p55 [Plasmodium ovale wallikeri]|uniref:26S proteasome subunit p55 n=1 Tax=Plasmodium ovale wallikeri TaxID=864142 RepID=A0A1A8YM18_PLAOA|nr:26S proteasome subunit p55 [Plasmodium ovale wallikeri]SBT33153.1 26S proteasome subunit p55 [Plasmodium ovale wallikeri]
MEDNAAKIIGCHDSLLTDPRIAQDFSTETDELLKKAENYFQVGAKVYSPRDETRRNTCMQPRGSRVTAAWQPRCSRDPHGTHTAGALPPHCRPTANPHSR